jgi:hypothetical protein
MFTEAMCNDAVPVGHGPRTAVRAPLGVVQIEAAPLRSVSTLLDAAMTVWEHSAALTASQLPQFIIVCVCV